LPAKVVEGANAAPAVIAAAPGVAVTYASKAASDTATYASKAASDTVAYANTTFIEKPTTIATAACTSAVKNVDAGIEKMLPFDNTKPSKDPSVAGCVSKVYHRLPANLVKGAKAAPAAVSNTVTQVCTETGRVMHTTISTVQGKTTATFHLIADGVQSKIVVPIHSGLVKLNDTLKITDKVQYTADLFQRALQPILNNSLVVAIGERAKQLEATVCPNLRAAIEAQLKTLTNMLALSSKPVSQPVYMED